MNKKRSDYKGFTGSNPQGAERTHSRKQIPSVHSISSEEALRRSEERLKLAQAAAGAGIWDVNLLTGEHDWSDELYGLFGLKPETKASFENWKRIMHPDDRENVWLTLSKAIKNKQPLDVEYRIVKSSGKVHWLRALGNTIQSDEGKPSRVIGICIDITSQKEKELEIQALANEIQKDRDHFAALVNSITDEIWFADKNGKVTLVNPAVRKEFGDQVAYDQDIETVASSFEVYRADGSPRPVNEAPPLRALKGEIISNEEEIVRSPASGELRYRQVKSAPVHDSQGAIIGSVSVVRDITRRRENQKKIEYNEERNRVLSEVASELLVSQDIQKAIDNICGIVMKFLHCQAFFNFLVVPEMNKLHLNAFHGISIEEAKRIEWLNFGVAVCGCVAFQGRRIVAESIQNSEDDITKLIKGYGIRAYCCHPLKAADSVIGTLSFGTSERDSWTPAEISFMEAISGLMSVAIQRKQLEDELVRSHQDLERAQRIGSIGSWSLDLQKNELVWSDENYRIFAVQWGTPLTYESFLSMVHPDDREYVHAKWMEGLAGKDYDIEHRIIADGTLKWVREKAFLEFDEKGKLLSGFGITQDISKRKQAEMELESAKKRLDLALENANIGLWELDVKTGSAYMDERTEMMFGLSLGTFDRSLDAFEKLVHDEDIEHVRNTLVKTLQNGAPYETIFRTKPLNGKYRYLSAKALAGKDEKGDIVSLSGVIFDITDLKEGTEQLISKLNMDLLRSNNDLQQFAYVASHDLQEPLRMVSSFTQLLQKQYADKLDQNANDYINFAVNGSKRMYELINGLLAYSRVQTRTVQFTRVNMNAVLAKVKENLKLLMNETNARVTSDDLPEITADENQMIQMLQNLIENGIKFSKGIPVIHISAREAKGIKVFSVKDKGIGIEKQYFERIFRIFQKLHTPHEYKGTGIGLAMCKKIVERHGGEIWVESEPGKGTEFFFTIPE